MTRAETKRAVRERDGYVCTRCGLTNAEHVEIYGTALQVHRKVPGSPYTVEGGVTLCIPCHGPEPKRKAGEPDAANPGRLSLALPPELAEAVERYKARFRIEHDVQLSSSMVAEKALIALFREAGLDLPDRSAD